MRSSTQSVLIATLLLACTGTLTAVAGDNQTANLPRGVPPSKAALYQPVNGKFTCADGSLTIPFERVNDDYCDCDDGSDEPGTAACPNGVFYCANAGHRPAEIPSSRVNDGLCDPRCCDGSDEYDGKVNCPNRCHELAEAERERIKARREAIIRGAKTRQDYAKKGMEARREQTEKLEELKKERSELEMKIAELEDAKERVEKLEMVTKEDPNAKRVQAYKDRADALEELLNKAVERLMMAEADTQTLINILTTMKEEHNPNYHDMAVKHAITAFEGLEKERAQRGGSLGTADLIPPPQVDDSEFDGSTADKPWEYKPPTWMDKLTTIWESIMSSLGMRQLSIEQVLRDVKSGRFYSADALRRAHSEAVSRKYKIDGDIDKLERKAKIDFGPDARFSAIDEKCFELQQHEYTYKICMFDTIKQTKKGEYGSTNLGHFRGWDDTATDPEAKYRRQYYRDGQYCWDGPNRSTEVIFECGEKEEVLSVEEPAKCVYRLRMTTPAVCSLDQLDETTTESPKVHDEL